MDVTPVRRKTTFGRQNANAYTVNTRAFLEVLELCSAVELIYARDSNRHGAKQWNVKIALNKAIRRKIHVSFQDDTGVSRWDITVGHAFSNRDCAEQIREGVVAWCDTINVVLVGFGDGKKIHTTESRFGTKDKGEQMGEEHHRQVISPEGKDTEHGHMQPEVQMEADDVPRIPTNVMSGETSVVQQWVVRDTVFLCYALAGACTSEKKSIHILYVTGNEAVINGLYALVQEVAPALSSRTPFLVSILKKNGVLQKVSGSVRWIFKIDASVPDPALLPVVYPQDDVLPRPTASATDSTAIKRLFRTLSQHRGGIVVRQSEVRHEIDRFNAYVDVCVADLESFLTPEERNQFERLRFS